MLEDGTRRKDHVSYLGGRLEYLYFDRDVYLLLLPLFVVRHAILLETTPPGGSLVGIVIVSRRLFCRARTPAALLKEMATTPAQVENLLGEGTGRTAGSGVSRNPVRSAGRLRIPHDVTVR